KMLESSGVDKALGAAKKGQINGLMQLLKEGVAPASFQPQEWIVLTSGSENVILGDIAAFASDASGKAAQVMVFGQQWSHIYLPISPSKVLVASRDDTPKLT